MGISTVVKAYGQFYDTLKSDASSCLPEIRMKLALSLANLPSEYQYLALEQGNKAFSDWLRANDAPSDKVFDLDNDADCQLLKRIIYQEDKPFLESLKLLLEKVKDADGIDGSQSAGINSLLAGWQFLNRFGNIPHLPALGEPMVVEEKLRSSMPNITENFTEVLRNRIELEMIAIPPGDFILFGDKPTVVKLKGFWMSKYPITQAQYEAIMFYNPSYFRGDSNHPVEQVTWDNAQEFCGKLSEKTGKSYQLPSEVQWVYALNGESTTNDMYNIVYEWCQDNYSDGNRYLFEPKPKNISPFSSPNPDPAYPTDGSAFIEPSNVFVLRYFNGSTNHSHRGHCSRDFLIFIGKNNRLYRHDYMTRQVGFRVVCVP
jgi:formylglycine-generating enzyme required for sulfatase activity